MPESITQLVEQELTLLGAHSDDPRVLEALHYARELAQGGRPDHEMLGAVRQLEGRLLALQLPFAHTGPLPIELAAAIRRRIAATTDLTRT